MPELPEVETIRRNLRLGNPSLLGKSILSVEVLWERSVETPRVEEFQERLRGQTVLEIGRRGKFLIFDLSQDDLLIHLRMSGDLILEPADADIAAHHRLIFYLDQDLRLAFNDVRKFGRAWLVKNAQEVVGSLGPEPLDLLHLSPEEFGNRLRRTKRRLKPLLIDQRFLAGLGNIYADEALYLARLHPQLPADQVGAEEAKILLKAIRQVLQEGIQHNGASIDWVYRGGGFQNHFRVYQRTGEPCPRCGTAIERILVGQRGTHFCPRCQDLSRI